MKAVYAGSFSPLTIGHKDIVIKASNIFNEIVVVQTCNSQKVQLSAITDSYFKNNIEMQFGKCKVIFMRILDSLTTEICKALGAQFLIRGIRNTNDYTYENTIYKINKQLCNDIETVYFMPSLDVEFVSSSMVREFEKYGKECNNFLWS